MRVLIVDDSRSMRAILRGHMEGLGFECQEAADGQQALDRLKEGQPFDLALVDWNMPVLNGLETIKALRGLGYGDMKVMMVTTEFDHDFIVQALDAGADEYLMKPFDEDALMEKLSLLGIEGL